MGNSDNTKIENHRNIVSDLTRLMIRLGLIPNKSVTGWTFTDELAYHWWKRGVGR